MTTQYIRKRSGQLEPYNQDKIIQAMARAFAACEVPVSRDQLQNLADQIEKEIQDDMDVESIQNIVEKNLMAAGQYQTAKAYILYRQHQLEKRQLVSRLSHQIPIGGLAQVLKEIQKEFWQESYNLQILELKFTSFLKNDQTPLQRLSLLEKAAAELVSPEAPLWESIGARLLALNIQEQIRENTSRLGLVSWLDKLKYMTRENLVGEYLLENYSDADVAELEAAMKPERDRLFKQPGLELLAKRYLLRDHSHHLLESPQEMFMAIAMHLAIPEENRVYWARKIYDVLSTLKATMATPTMANARRPFHQMSSCFIDTVEDSLTGIYQSVDNFAQVSKHGGGMGLYFGKVRASGSDIRGFEGAAGGVIRWIKLINDTAIAVDQLGVRQGAAAVYLDVWHRDLPEFLQLRTNNGDDRMKAHDIFPAVCFPDLFWHLAKTDIDASWYMMDPHEIQMKKGWALEDFYGKAWEEKYRECIADSRIEKRILPVKEIVRMFIKSLVETGTPFAFNRDTVNEANPNKHKGIIYASNLCTEIAQNMSAMQVLEPEIMEVDGQTVVRQQTIPGDFVVCNLASLSLGHLNVDDEQELEETISVIVRALDNVISLNYYALPYARITNHQYRAIGLGTSGLHHRLALNQIPFESEKHLVFADALYEKINYYALKASHQLALEKGPYTWFKGSDYDTGRYFADRDYTSSQWQQLAHKIHADGLRNGYLMAIAPTSSTSILSGTTAAVDPILKKYYMEEKKGSMITRVAPDLSMDTFWFYKNAHLIDQNWVVDAAAIRQRHIDQAQSVNLYITNDYTFRRILNLYLRAWKKGVKTIYYVRSQSLEVEECESCAS